MSESWYESPGDATYPEPDWEPLNVGVTPWLLSTTTAPHVTWKPRP